MLLIVAFATRKYVDYAINFFQRGQVGSVWNVALGDEGQRSRQGVHGVLGRRYLDGRLQVGRLASLVVLGVCSSSGLESVSWRRRPESTRHV